jgi:hypothetical protein
VTLALISEPLEIQADCQEAKEVKTSVFLLCDPEAEDALPLGRHSQCCSQNFFFFVNLRWITTILYVYGVFGYSRLVINPT